MESSKVAPPSLNLLDLPPELISHICEFLPFNDGKALAKSHPKLATIALSLIKRNQTRILTEIGEEISTSFAFLNNTYKGRVEEQTKKSLLLIDQSKSLKEIIKINFRFGEIIIKTGTNKALKNFLLFGSILPHLSPCYSALKWFIEGSPFIVSQKGISERITTIACKILYESPRAIQHTALILAERGVFDKKGAILYAIIQNALGSFDDPGRWLELAKRLENREMQKQARLKVICKANYDPLFFSHEFFLSCSTEERLAFVTHFMPHSPIEMLDKALHFFDNPMKKKMLPTCFNQLDLFLLLGRNGIQKMVEFLSPLLGEEMPTQMLGIFKALETIYKKHQEEPEYFVRWVNDLNRLKNNDEESDQKSCYYGILTIIERQSE